MFVVLLFVLSSFIHELTSLTLTSSTTSSSFSSEMGLSSSNSKLFEKPTFGVSILVDTEGPSSNEEWTPFLKTLNRFNTEAIGETQVFSSLDLDKARSLSSPSSFALTTSNGEELNDEIEMFWKYTNNKLEKVLHNEKKPTGKHFILVEDGQPILDGELFLIENLITKIGLEGHRPGFVYAKVFGVSHRNSLERSNTFQRLSNGLERIFHTLKRSTKRPLLTVQFTEKKQGPEIQKVSQTQFERRRLAAGAKTQPFMSSDYVLICWTLVFLAILVIFVFLCIPWAPVLDPALRSSLKSDSKLD